MNEVVSIGLIGDFDPAHRSHQATVAALGHAADYLSIKIDVCWVPTESLLGREYRDILERFAGLWAAPGSYRSQEGAINGIQFAREGKRPFLGT